MIANARARFGSTNFGAVTRAKVLSLLMTRFLDVRADSRTDDAGAASHALGMVPTGEFSRIVMSHALKLHPDSRCTAVTHIDVAVARAHGQLTLTYLVTGKIGDLRLAPPGARARADGLWQHTCFEAFVRRAPSPRYYELNFAPSTQWAAYRFRGYREGLVVVEDMAPPHIESRPGAESYSLEAVLKLDALPSLPADVAWRLNLSAVIEEVDGRKSYWALAHTPGKPDFHHADNFVLELPAT